MTDHMKRRLYALGFYSMRVPDVTTGRWDEAAWIKWIDASGKWREPPYPCCHKPEQCVPKGRCVTDPVCFN